MLGHTSSRGSLGGPPAYDYLINQSVFNRLSGGHEEIAVRVLLDLLEVLAGVARQDAVDLLARVQNLARLDVDIDRLTARAAERLMNQDALMGQRVAPSLLARGQQHRTH
jgi:hypothetical protein